MFVGLLAPSNKRRMILVERFQIIIGKKSTRHIIDEQSKGKNYVQLSPLESGPYNPFEKKKSVLHKVHAKISLSPCYVNCCTYYCCMVPFDGQTHFATYPTTAPFSRDSTPF